jgi:hypothetical protein
MISLADGDRRSSSAITILISPAALPFPRGAEKIRHARTEATRICRPPFAGAAFRACRGCRAGNGQVVRRRVGNEEIARRRQALRSLERGIAGYPADRRLVSSQQRRAEAEARSEPAPEMRHLRNIHAAEAPGSTSRTRPKIRASDIHLHEVRARSAA